MNPRRPTATSTSLLRAALLLALALASASAGRADDRGLISASTIKPYVFVLLDTSGSMNWTPSCTQAEYDTFLDPPANTKRTCDYVCPAGDCAPPRYADDPASKFRQAKESLYEVMQSIDDEKADFGFGSFDQDNIDIRWKHWLYRLQDSNPSAGHGPIAVGSGAGAFVWPPPATPSARIYGETFGRTFSEGGLSATSSYSGAAANSDCDTGNSGDNEVGCYARNPADLIDSTYTAAQADPYWELQRVLRMPKLGATNTDTVFFYVRYGGTTYWVNYAPVGGQTLGAATIDVSITVASCTNPTNNCDAAGERTVVATKTVRFERVGDFLMWTYGLYRRWDDVNSTSSDYFSTNNSNYAVQTSADNTCDGLELNTDRDSDRDTNCSLTTPATGSQYYPCNIKHPTIQDPAGRDTTTTKYFDIGDRIPADWDETRSLTLKQEILRRLAPSLSLGEADPTLNNGFGQARYLTDLPVSPENLLRVKNPNIAGRPLDPSFGARPLIANGSTPLGGILRGFSQWYCGADLQSANCSTTEGWRVKAEQGDDFWGCRSKFIIMLTDGDDTCSSSGNPCTMAANLQSRAGIRTYVIGFGVPSATGNSLSCIAQNGGTTAPYNPRNKQELIEALQDIFNEILERTSTFASAAVPTVQATVTDKVFISNFTPVKEAPIWAGSLYGFLKPLPLGPTGSPETTIRCSSTVRSKCFLWDAGDVQVDGYSPETLLLQAPNSTEVAAGNLRIGVAADQRRVFYRYGTANTFTLDASASRRWFRYPDAADELDFWSGMGIDPVKFPTAAAKRAEANTAVRYALVEKTGQVTNPSTNVTHTLTYILGDIFHSDPVVVDSPRDSRLYRDDPYSTSNAPSLCSVPPSVDPPRSISPSYRDFVNHHACRRKMILVGANDGQLHAFDAGTWTLNLCDFNTESVGYSDGTGKELFSFIPRAALPDVYDFKPDTSVTPEVTKEQRWTVDGRLRVFDAFIDPRHTGTPTCLDREWRTVAIGSMREGGRSYFALDVTQPDTYNVLGVPARGVGDYVPTCIDGGSACGDMPFPAVLWEFVDTWNEDNAGPATTAGADLGNTWSSGIPGRIRVCTANCGTANARTEDRWVMVVGGGLGEDPTEIAGNWLYMIDVESGLALYKRQLQGASPAAPAAVDSDQDGYLDTIYAGTTAGLVYKVELGSPRTSPLPLTSQIARDYSTPNASAGTVYTDRTVTRIISSRAKPFVVFSTGGRPIYMEITVLYVGKLGKYALAFGTGDRWDLWDDSGQVAHFYTILDTGFVDVAENSGAGDGVADRCASGPCATTGYRTAADYLAIDPESAFDPNAPTPQYLIDAPSGYQAGWYLPLRANEKLITDPFAFAGILSFTSYDPETQPTDTGTCIRTGTSRIFVVKTTNADPYVFPNPNNASVRRRYWTVGDFTTQPFVEQRATKNPGNSSDHRQTADQLCDGLTMDTMREELKELMPGDCKFNNMSLEVKTIRSDTGMVCIAPVPECVAERHWKEY